MPYSLLSPVGSLVLAASVFGSILSVPDDCPEVCLANAPVSTAGPGIDPGDGLMAISISNLISGTATVSCGATCDLCEVYFILTYASYNPGQFKFKIQSEAGETEIDTDNYNRPGILKSKCNPAFAPFFTALAEDATTGTLVQSETIALDCFCN